MAKQNIARFIQSLRFTGYAMHASDQKKSLSFRYDGEMKHEETKSA